MGNCRRYVSITILNLQHNEVLAMLKEIWELIAPALLVLFIIGVCGLGAIKLDNGRQARIADRQQAIVAKLDRLGYRDRDNVEVWLKSTDWYMSDFLKSKTVRQKYKKWTK